MTIQAIYHRHHETCFDDVESVQEGIGIIQAGNEYGDMWGGAVYDAEANMLYLSEWFTAVEGAVKKIEEKFGQTPKISDQKFQAFPECD